MIEQTRQMQSWEGQFGKDYTDRNAHDLEHMESLYKQRCGVSRTELNDAFLGSLDRSARILEVGCNIGNQLLCLQKMGFHSLYGIDLQAYAVEQAKARTKNINIIQGGALDIPFKDGYFDVVFTSCLLMHIAPSDIAIALGELHRCSSRYIFAYEYFAEDWTEVNYRGQDQLLWKNNFAKLFLDKFPDLKLIKEQRFKYPDSDLVDTAFLLEKTR